MSTYIRFFCFNFIYLLLLLDFYENQQLIFSNFKRIVWNTKRYKIIKWMISNNDEKTFFLFYSFLYISASSFFLLAYICQYFKKTNFHFWFNFFKVLVFLLSLYIFGFFFYIYNVAPECRKILYSFSFNI